MPRSSDGDSPSLEGLHHVELGYVVGWYGDSYPPLFRFVLDLYGLCTMQLVPRAWHTLIEVLFVFLDYRVGIPSLKF